MCTWQPMRCALRDGHNGLCLTPQQLDTRVTNITASLDHELHQLEKQADK